MSITTQCPFGCLPLQTELSEFKQISINYFDQIMFKFNNQDKIINELLKKLDQCMNFNYENGYGDQWQSEVNQTVLSEEIENVNEQNDDVIPFSMEPENDKLSTDVQRDLEHDNLLTDDQIPAKSAVDLMGEMLDEHFQTEACEMQEEATIPEYDEDLVFESMGCELNSPSTSGHDQTKNKTSYIRTSGNRSKMKRLRRWKHPSSSQLFDAHTKSGSPLQIRERYSSTVDNCDGSSTTVKCNLCGKIYIARSFATHFEMVHFGRKFRCQICKWSNSQRIRVQRHIQNSHSVHISETSQHLKVLFLN